MGYDIRFTLVCPKDGPDQEDVAAMLAGIADGKPEGRPGHETSAGYWNEILQGSRFYTWHQCQDHMAQVSAAYPGKLFSLELAGENADFDDFWVFHFRDGQVQEARGHVVYPDFDPLGLQAPRLREMDAPGSNPIREANLTDMHRTA